ncbi:MAG: hypothetical protein OK438_00935 [Thaumarchaeota archaeon]|nr:hypothetical protein [Nitrososphaerota archaeon]
MSARGFFQVGSLIRLRLGALVGWTSIAGTGALLLLNRGGPFPATQLSELLATWAGVSGILWVVSARLKK